MAKLRIEDVDKRLDEIRNRTTQRQNGGVVQRLKEAARRRTRRV